jgi:hypothetical protein
MVNYVSTIVFVFLLLPGLLFARALGATPPRAVTLLVVWILADLLVGACRPSRSRASR